MEFYKALKTITDLQGEKILEDERLANILSDFKAYEEVPSLKFLVKMFQQEKLFSAISTAVKKEQNIDMLLLDKASEVHSRYGFDVNQTHYLFQSVAYALGFTSIEPSLEQQSQQGSLSFEEDPQEEFAPLNQPAHIVRPPMNPVDGLHIKFKNLPLTGMATEYCRKLVKAGLIETDPYNDDIDVGLLYGRFADVDGCQIAVFGTPISKIVYKVLVFLPAQYSWLSLKGRYMHFKEILSNIHGTPESYEFFVAPYCEGDGDEMEAISVQKCNYGSFWHTSNGDISLVISCYDDTYNVSVSYEDLRNTKTQERENGTLMGSEL